MMTFIRYGIPALFLLASVVLLIARKGDLTAWEGAFALWGAGGSVLLINALMRIGFSGDQERHQEESDRRFFEQHGHWPDEPPPAPLRRRRS